LGTKRKHDFELYCKMREIGSAQSDSCPRMIRKLGCIPRTLLATWSAMQICPTRALWRFSAIPTPALTNCFSPFRLLRKDQFPDLVRLLEDLGDDYGTCFPMPNTLPRFCPIINGGRKCEDCCEYQPEGIPGPKSAWRKCCGADAIRVPISVKAVSR
jgi:hypothetical protein